VWKARHPIQTVSEVQPGSKISGHLNTTNLNDPKALLSPIPSSSTVINISELLFSVATDPRPYLPVTIMGKTFVGLLDSGSSRTIVNDTGSKYLKELGLITSPGNIPEVLVADGRPCPSNGIITAPVTLNSITKLIDIIIVPSISPQLVLGTDFWTAMNLVVDIAAHTWYTATPQLSSISSIQTSGLKHLTPPQQRKLKALTDRHFKLMGTKLGCTDRETHVIDTGQAKPIKQRYYPVSPRVQENINSELDRMLLDGVVEPSSSAWSSPVLLVKKPNGQHRFCIDFRKLNAVTTRDAYPLPYLTQILDRLKDAKYISSLDIKTAFWQVPLDPSSKDKTAFTVPGRGLYQFTRMPMGLHNSTATWQRLVDNILRPDLEPYLFVYLDDIIIVTPTFQLHLEVMNSVLTRLHEAGLTVNQEKCEFCLPELKYLGYVIDASGLKVNPEKVEAIVNIPQPQSVKEVRKFLGVASWYRRFIPNFATQAEPLTSMQRKNHTFKWTPEAETAFQCIKTQLVQAPILTCPNFELPFQVQTDASGVGIGAVIYQETEEGETVIAYASRSLTREERKYNATERECLAVLWAVEKWRPYLEGYDFTVHTDHASLLWLHNLKDPQGRLGRWALRLSQYRFSMVHRKGKENVVADYLSRAPFEHVTIIDIPDIPVDPWYTAMKHKVATNPLKHPDWRIEHNRLYKFLDTHTMDPESEWKLIVPEESRQAVYTECHDNITSGHLGARKTWKRAQQHYFWPRMHRDISNYVHRCDTCQRMKKEQHGPTGLMGASRTATGPWIRISTDLIGPFPRSTQGHKYIIVISDTFTKYTLLFPIRSAQSHQICKKIEEEIFLVYNVPQYIVCDNGPEFISFKFKSLTKKYGCQIHYTARRHPQANPTERTNLTVMTMLRSYVKDNHKTWDKCLPQIACALRTAESDVTGYSPFYLNFGRNQILYGKDHQKVKDNIDIVDQVEMVSQLSVLFKDVYNRLQRAHDKAAHHYNLRRRPLNLQLGDEVLKLNFTLSDANKDITAKLVPRYTGPFTVVNKLSPVIYQLQDAAGKDVGRWHVSDLKPYKH
jgi:RNase H-like domain found in reverse transcriptase/Reverse transcriptase (RNA-dependent DNA polymerase)/Integrase zinc binding domain/Integrase core domain